MTPFGRLLDDLVVSFSLQRTYPGVLTGRLISMWVSAPILYDTVDLKTTRFVLNNFLIYNCWTHL